MFAQRISRVLLVAVAFSWCEARAQEIAAANSSRPIGKDLWEWTIHLKAPPALLRQIKCVEYTLHPTFKDRVQHVCERTSDDTAFPLTATGWGTFAVNIKVTFQNGDTRRLQHTLTFVEKPADPNRKVRLTNNAVKDTGNLWRWTAFLQAPENDLNDILCVDYTLHETFRQPNREVCEKGNSDRAFALTATGWGTFELAARVRFRDGTTLRLTHELVFPD